MANRRQIRDIERRSWQLWAITLTTLLSLAVFIILVYFYWTIPEGGGRDVYGYNKFAFLLGFSALIFLFCSYVVFKEMEIKKIRLILIERQIQLETLNRRFKEVESLFKVSTVVNSQLDASAILNTITKTVVECLDADQSSLLLTDETKQVFRCKAAYGLGCERVLDKEIKPEEGIAGYVVVKGEPLLLNGKVDGSIFKNFVKKDINIASALCAPLKVNKKIIGVLDVNRIEREEEFTENDLKLLSIFADNAAVAIDKVALHQKLQFHIKSLEQANKELKETRARLIESEKMAAIGETTAHIAHRIFNPLTTIISGLQLEQLTRDGEDEADRDVTYLKRMQGEAERIKRIIRSVLTYSSPSTMDKKRTDLNELLEEALDQVEYISSSNGINIYKHLSTDLPKVMVDKFQLKEAFVNVMVNSLDAMRHGGNLTISTSVRSSELKYHTDLIEASVTDTGTGIYEENLDKVFQPFFTTKNPKDGTGLGLATTYGIIRNHDGEIDITSKYGHGTTVTIYLPAG